MLDQAELDFGIYRVMNFRRKEIKSFIENDLLNQVKTELDKITKTRLTTSASTASSSA
jgi:adenine-specific DNA-methyltransferase